MPFLIVFYGIHEGFAVAVWLPSVHGSPHTTLPPANGYSRLFLLFLLVFVKASPFGHDPARKGLAPSGKIYAHTCLGLKLNLHICI
jgi:hypothetical protein